MSKRKDYTGKKFGKLTVLRYIGSNSRGEALWQCSCDCGKEVVRSRRTFKEGKISSCGCYIRELSKKSIKKIQGKGKLSFGESAKNRIIRNYKRGAKNRNLEWKLTNQQVENLFKNFCHYCGEPPSLKISEKNGYGYFVYNGIDRKDNTKGYTKTNCVSCCKTCNMCKGSMSYENFIGWHIRLFKHNYNEFDTFKKFFLMRKQDVNGISGTGIVARGVIFPKDGKVAMEWESKYDTISIFSSIDEVIQIHGHEGRTVLMFDYLDKLEIK